MFVKIQQYDNCLLINVDTIRSIMVKPVSAPYTDKTDSASDEHELYNLWMNANKPYFARQSDPNHLYVLFLENSELPMYISKSEYESIYNNINVINKENNVYDKCVTYDSAEERWYNVRNNIRQDA